MARFFDSSHSKRPIIIASYNYNFMLIQARPHCRRHPGQLSFTWSGQPTTNFTHDALNRDATIATAGGEACPRPGTAPAPMSRCSGSKGPPTTIPAGSMPTARAPSSAPLAPQASSPPIPTAPMANPSPGPAHGSATPDKSPSQRPSSITTRPAPTTPPPGGSYRPTRLGTATG